MVSFGPAPPMCSGGRGSWHRPRPADRAVQLVRSPSWSNGSPANMRSRISIVSRIRAARAVRRAGADAVGLELALDRTPPEPELEPAFREHVDRRGHLGEHRGVTERIAGHEVADADRRGAHRERGGERPPLEGVVLGRGRRGEVVHQPHRVEPRRLGRRASAPGSSANDIRSWGRNSPNQGCGSVESTPALVRRARLVELGLEPFDVAAGRVLVGVVELHDDRAARARSTRA